MVRLIGKAALRSAVPWFLLLGSGAVWAVETVQVSEAGTDWLWFLRDLPETDSLAAAALAFLTAWAVRWGWVRKWRLERAVECLSSGVRETYEEYVRAIKKSREDGKLTNEERSQAMAMALEKARMHALASGFDLLKVHAAEYLPVLVERIIGARKSGEEATE